jgi:hypothetical protein
MVFSEESLSTRLQTQTPKKNKKKNKTMAEEKKGWTRLVVPDCSFVSFGKILDLVLTLRIEKYQTAIEEAIENISLDCPHDV